MKDIDDLLLDLHITSYTNFTIDQMERYISAVPLVTDKKITVQFPAPQTYDEYIDLGLMWFTVILLAYNKGLTISTCLLACVADEDCTEHSFSPEFWQEDPIIMTATDIANWNLGSAGENPNYYDALILEIPPERYFPKSGQGIKDFLSGFYPVSLPERGKDWRYKVYAPFSKIMYIEFTFPVSKKALSTQSSTQPDL